MKPSDPTWDSFVGEPVVIADDDSNWDQQTDLLVVGFGGAGAAAAIEAAQLGARVTVLERFQGGGATQLSGGIIYAGGGTRQQRAAGVEDDSDNMFRYLKTETEGCVSDETLREFCDGSVEMMEWLERLGLEFPGGQCPIKTSYPDYKYYLYYSGNEGLPVNAKLATPAPRGHRHQAKGQAGAEMFKRLKQATLDAGVNVMLQTKVTRLIVDDQGAVVGVEAQRIDPGSKAARSHARIMNILGSFAANGVGLMKSYTPKLEKLEAQAPQTIRIRADKGVVLATGGFISNPGMVTTYLSKYKGAMMNGAPGCDGSGIRLGESVGGATRMMDHASAWRFINPPLAFAQSAIVNHKGERFCNESAYGAQIGFYMCERNDGRAWIILDQALFDQAKKQAMPWRALWFQSLLALLTIYFNKKKSDTLEGLAAACGFDPATFTSHIETYNKSSRGEVEDPQHKAEEFHAVLDKGPYYALDIGKHSKTFVLAVISFGGLVVEENNSQVKRADGTLVSGLYAVGRAAAGLPSNHYMSGFAIADCIFTGRRAAQDAINSAEPATGAKAGLTPEAS